MKLVFHPILTVSTLLAFAILVSLGLWQLQRLEWKRDLVASVEARLAAAPVPLEEALARAAAGENLDYRPVIVAGVYRHDLEAHVFGTLEGAPGYYVFTPLIARPDNIVFVNRGFVPQGAQPDARSDPDAQVTVVGLFRRAETPAGLQKLFRPKDQPGDNLFFVRDPRKFAAQRGIEAPPFYVDSNGAENAGRWPRGGTTRVEFENRHLEYAFTWFGLAAVLVAVLVAFSLRRP